MRPFKEEFGEILANIKRHTKLVDNTAAAIEMLRTSEFRKGNSQSSHSVLELTNY